jgi:hypothetical protein
MSNIPYHPLVRSRREIRLIVLEDIDSAAGSLVSTLTRLLYSRMFRNPNNRGHSELSQHS